MELFGFREGNGEIFNHIMSTPTNKEQESPFVLIKNNGNVKEMKSVNELLDNARPDEWVLRTWVGKWKSDVFKFKCGDLEQYAERQGMIPTPFSK